MIDLHTHVLPGVDDGPGTMEEAVEMCRLAAGGGCDTIVATPHQRHPSWANEDPAALAQRLLLLQRRIGEGPRLLLGAEIRIGSSLLDDLDRGTGAGALPLAGSRYLLLEADHQLPGLEPGELVHELVLRGWRPIFAHPEFIPWLHSDSPLIDELIDLGASMQVTAGSLLGKFGRRAQRSAYELLGTGRIHFVASDAHGTSWRPPDLGEARAQIAAHWGEQTAWRLCIANPRSVLSDRPLAVGAA